MENSTPVTRHLEALNIPYRFFRHAGQVYSLAQAALERGLDPDQVIRSIVFRLGPDRFAMVLIAGDRQISWPALRKYVQQSRLTLAAPEELLRVTGYEKGAVSPFGLPAPMRILIDQSVLSHPVVSLGSGERNTTVILASADLVRGTGAAEIGNFAQAPGPEN